MTFENGEDNFLQFRLETNFKVASLPFKSIRVLSSFDVNLFLYSIVVMSTVGEHIA